MFPFRTAQRSVLAGAVGVALVLSGAACSSNSSGGGGSGSSASPISLSLMIWDPAQKAGVQKAVDGFQAQNPNVKVSLEQVPVDQYYTKLDASLGAGEGPDVMWQSSRASVYVQGGALEPLDSYIAQDKVTLDNFPTTLVKLYNFDGKQYGMPKDQDVWTYIYNTSVFKKLGISDVPTTNWTWDDMLRIAGEIKAKQTSGFPLWYGFSDNGPVSSIITALGGTVVKDGNGTLSSPQGLEALAMVKNLQDKKYMPAVADSTDFNSVTSLISGNIAMARIRTENLPVLAQAAVPTGTFKAVPVPSINGSHASDTNGLAYVMNSKTAHKDEAWKLIKFITSDEGAKLHVAGGASHPASKSADVQAAYFKANSAVTGLDSTFAVMIPDQFLRTTSQFPVLRPVMDEIDATAFGPFYAGKLTAQQATQMADGLLTKGLK